MCAVPLSYGAKTFAVFSRGLSCVSTLHLDKDNLEGVTSLQSLERLGMVFPNRYQVYHSSRFFPGSASEGEQMPVRERRMRDSLPDANLRHGYGPLRCVGGFLEPSFVINLLRSHRAF